MRIFSFFLLSFVYGQSLDVTFRYVENQNDDFVRVFDMKPGAIIERLNLTSVNYRTDTLFSHFGHSNINWEKIENI